MSWLAENAGNLLVGGLVLAAAALAVRSLMKDRKAGKSSCGCGCASCPMSGKCHSEKK